jgi:hypothetical protein
MNAALQDFRIIWRTATTQREPQAMRTLSMVAAAGAACLAILFILGAMTGKLDGMDVARLLIGCVTLWQMLVWTFGFVPGSIRMNSPINARLLPRQRRRLVQMTTVYWLLTTVGIAFGIGNWMVLPTAALGTLGLMLLSAGNKHVVTLLVVGGNWPWLARVALPPAWGDVATGNAAMAVLCALVLPAAVWTLRWLYPAGGDAYLERRGEQLKRVARFDQCGEDNQPMPGGMAELSNLSFYRVALRCDLRQHRRRADPAAMLMHALGPTAHWTAWIGAIAMMLLIGGAARIALAWLHGAAVETLVGQMAAVGPALLALTVAFSTAQYGQQMRRTHGEQALLRLTPLAGNAALLNRRLATRMLRQAVAIWAALTAAVLAVTFFIGAGPDALLRQLGLCCLAGQAAMVGLLGDYAGSGGWNLTRGLGAGGAAFVQAMIAILLGSLTGTTPWPWLVALPLIVCAAWLRYDWRRMLAAPPAFPAGRMA